MIEIDFNWSDNTQIASLLLAIAGLPLLLFLKKAAFRKWQLALHLLLWIVLIAFVLQPKIRQNQSGKTKLLFGKEVLQVRKKQIGDSLAGAEIISESELAKIAADTIVLAGQDFPDEIFGKISQLNPQPVVRWLPVFLSGELQNLNWKGIVRKGEMQVVRGALESPRKQTLKAVFETQTLDSIVLKPGQNTFKLNFPAFAAGRSEVVMQLDGKSLDTVRFYARPPKPANVKMVFENPDFESRNLAAWLGKNGNAVNYNATVSKNMLANVNINAGKAPDFIIADPGSAANAAVRKAANSGAPILFINITDPESEIPAINRATGSHFQARKIQGDSVLKVLPGLNALPYRFVPNIGQLILPGLPVAFEKGRNTVAVSLLQETFPMQLSGDSAHFQQVWDQVLTYLQPEERNMPRIAAPVVPQVSSRFEVTNSQEKLRWFGFGEDSLFTVPALFNAQAANARFVADQSGWFALGDSLQAEFFVEPQLRLARNVQMQDFIKRNSKTVSYISQKEKPEARPLPDWIWYALLMFCFTAIWLEEKFG